MTEHRRTAYDRARRTFDDLQIEDKAVFLIEATAATVARGVEQAGHALADELGGLFGARAKTSRAGRSRAEDRPGAAESETHRRPPGEGER